MVQPEAEPEGACLFHVHVAQARPFCLLALLFSLLFLQGKIAEAVQVEALAWFCFPLGLEESCFWVATWEAAFQNEKLSEWILQHLPAAQGWPGWGWAPLLFLRSRVRFLPSPHQKRGRESSTAAAAVAWRTQCWCCLAAASPGTGREAGTEFFSPQTPDSRGCRPPLSMELLLLERWGVRAAPPLSPRTQLSAQGAVSGVCLTFPLCLRHALGCRGRRLARGVPLPFGVYVCFR